jgi:hypothetical protein
MWWVVNIGGQAVVGLPHVMSGEYWWASCRGFATCDEWWILVGKLSWVYHMWWVVNIGGQAVVGLPHVMSGEYWWASCCGFTTCDEWWILVGNLSWVYHMWCDEWWILVGKLSWVCHVWWVVNIGGQAVMGLPHVMSGEYWWASCREFTTLQSCYKLCIKPIFVKPYLHTVLHKSLMFVFFFLSF